MKLLFASLLLTASCAGACATPPSPAPEFVNQTVERQYYATARIYLTCEDGVVSGTAVAISPTDLITARHVIVACRFSMLQALTLYGAYELKVVSISVGADVARLRVTSGGKFRNFASWVTAPVPVGSEVCSIGGDGGVPLMRKCGQVFFRDEKIVLSSIPAVPGNSGGPVFLRDRLVGIVSMGSWHPAAEKVQLFVPIVAFEDLLGGV